ncbi:MAG: hypothetical protein H8K03_02095 [Nitrospira sp.]
MKTSLIFLTLCIGLLTTESTILANPEMLPKHPGYPMGKAVDPVMGQSLANDPGQVNTNSEEALSHAAIIDDSHSKQSLLFNQNDARLLEKPGAGLLPKVEGPNVRIEPPVKKATEANASPQ